MSPTGPDLSYPQEDLRAFTEGVFQAAGVPPEDAALTADNLIQANLRGTDSHGIARLLVPYARRLRNGQMLPKTEGAVLRERPSTALLDGQNGIGQVVAARAMRLAMEKAERTGAAWVGVCRSNHFGAAGYFAQMALERDMVGIVSTNGPAAVAPFGGRRPMLSTNPLAFAIPAGEEPPVVLDMATTVVSRGRITLFAGQNLEIPSTWALDEDGNPTPNPHAALRGTLQPMAGYKGYGLSLVLDMLCGVLTGASYGMHFSGFLTDYHQPPADVGSLFAAVSVDSFMDAPQFKARVDTALRELKESPRAPGVDRIYAPGEIEHETRLRRLEEGVPLPQEAVEELRALGEECGVPFPNPSQDRSACL
jgi:LDH2 family malate/lactate/ureidoglycolate dehydrogenase